MRQGVSLIKLLAPKETMDTHTEIRKDILLTYVELMEERENFSGHYEGNPFNGINVIK